MSIFSQGLRTGCLILRTPIFTAYCASADCAFLDIDLRADQHMLGNVAARVLQVPPFRQLEEKQLVNMTAAGKSVHGMVYDGNDGQP